MNFGHIDQDLKYFLRNELQLRYCQNWYYEILGGARGVSGGARGVMVIVVGIGHGDTSSNPGRDWLHFT